MRQVLEAAAKIQEFCQENDWDFCFIGGIALQRWAIPRNTNDVDLTILSGIGPEEEITSKLLESFDSRIKEDPLGFFLSRRIVLIEWGSVGIDISLGALGFEESAVQRSSFAEFIPGITLRTCTAEDLVVFKAFANRLKDWADVENILTVQQALDWDYIDEQLSPLVELKEEPGILSGLSKLRDRLGR